MDTLSIFKLTGGLAIFLYGISLSTKSLEDIAGASLKLLLTRLTKKRLLALFTGALAAMSIQSSGGTMLMLVAFANAGLLTFFESIPMIIGAGIGSTLIVQVISFHIYKYAPILVTSGYFMFRFISAEKVKQIGNVIFSIGLLLTGMGLMKSAIPSSIGESVAMQEMGNFFAGAPFWALIFSFLLTTLFQSSVATMGLVITIAATGGFSLNVLLPFVLGANIGSCTIALIGSMDGNREAKKVAFGELVIRTSFAIILFILLKPFSALIEMTSSDVTRQVANAHTLFAFTTILALPFSKLLEKLLNVIVSERFEKNEFAPKYLDRKALQNPPVAISQATLEVIRAGELLHQMFLDFRMIFYNNDSILLEQMIDDDDKIDTLHQKLNEYIAQIATTELSNQESRRGFQLMNIIAEIEHIADILSKGLADQCRKKIETGYYLSDEGFVEILQYNDLIFENYELLRSALPTFNKEISIQALANAEQNASLYRDLFRSHVHRLQSCQRESEETSSIHLDILADLNRINVHCSYIAHTIKGDIEDKKVSFIDI